MAPLLLSLLLVLGLQFLLFILSWVFENDRLTDISYALSFIILGFLLVLVLPFSFDKALLFLIILVWALRLVLYVLERTRHMKVDHRLDPIRNKPKKFVTFFLLQGLTIWIIFIPVSMYMANPSTSMTVFSILGVLVWFIGLVIEAVADQQKFNFRLDPRNKGKWVNTGLWRVSRHPNYFGEMLCWVGIYIFTAPMLTGFRDVLGLVSPVFVVLLLLKFSGVPLVEAESDRKYGKYKSYWKYKQSTSLLIPRKPKKV